MTAVETCSGLRATGAGAAFTVSNTKKATGVPTTTTSRSFRKDLDVAAQVTSAAFHAEQRRRIQTIAVWETTCATREEHRCMLCALIGEAARQRSRGPQPLARRFTQGLVKDVNDDMAPHYDSARVQERLLWEKSHPDPYVVWLDRLASMSLFRS